jgi:hypothetical protein
MMLAPDPARRFNDWNWLLGTEDGKTISWEHVSIALLMDIRDAVTAARDAVTAIKNRTIGVPMSGQSKEDVLLVAGRVTGRALHRSSFLAIFRGLGNKL